MALRTLWTRCTTRSWAKGGEPLLNSGEQVVSYSGQHSPRGTTNGNARDTSACAPAVGSTCTSGSTSSLAG
eukprot:5404665-Heterocapsa_arctica.AAC.1